MRINKVYGRTRRRGNRLVAWLVSFLSLFCVLALWAEQPQIVRFAVIGDSGSGGRHQYRVADQMAAWHDRLPYDVVLMLGDNIYGFLWGGGNKQDFEKKFDRPYAKLLSRGVIFRASLGNHDLSTRGGKDLIEDYDRFHIDGSEGYYSFTAGTWLAGSSEAGAEHRFRTERKSEGAQEKPAAMVEFFVLNTERLLREKPDAEQLAWLERALADSRARWRILYGHHPLYSTGKRHGANPRLRQRVLPLLVGSPAGGSPRSEQSEGEAVSEPRVQVALAGHDHFYQRFHPQDGIVFFVCGSSGKLRRGDARLDAQVAVIEDRQRVFMLWEATAEELRYRAVNDEGKPFDCGIIQPDGSPEAVPCLDLSGSTNRTENK